MRNAIGRTLAAGLSVLAFGAVALLPDHAADMTVPEGAREVFTDGSVTSLFDPTPAGV